MPRDIPLDLPVPEPLLQFLIVFSFLLHILFVNVMVGSAILILYYELKGLKERKFDKLAREISKTLTVNKSLAVVLGVAPLLVMNTLYTIYFYTANALTGYYWIGVVPIVTVIFLLLYLHKYTWDTLAKHKSLHILILIFINLGFLFVPLIFLSNINLMLFPDMWTSVRGFFSALTVGNVFPRYFHFLAASLAVTSLFGVWWFGLRNFPIEEKLPGFDKESLKKNFYVIALAVNSLQFIIGPIILMTLPGVGISPEMVIVILSGASLNIPVVILLWKEISRTDGKTGSHFYKIVALLTIIVALMGTGRHLYRETALSPHREKMAIATEEYMAEVEKAYQERLDNTPIGEDIDLSPPIVVASDAHPGEVVFLQNCASCHKLNERLVGPPLTEIYEAYKGNPQGITEWTKDPGKKRDDYPQMPAVILTSRQYQNVADYILSIAAPTE